MWGLGAPIPPPSHTHLEDAGGPGAKGLLLAAEFVPFAQGQDPLATQLLQPGVHRVGEGTEMGVRAGSQPKDGEPEETKRVLSIFFPPGLSSSCGEGSSLPGTRFGGGASLLPPHSLDNSELPPKEEEGSSVPPVSAVLGAPLKTGNLRLLL